MKPITDAFRETIKRNLGKKEAEILFKFVEKKIIEGEFLTRVPICDKHIRMDVLCIKGSSIEHPISIYGKLDSLKRYIQSLRSVIGWILEIKEELNFEVLGQIIIDRYYFLREYPHINVELFGIICVHNDEYIEKVCNFHNIQVFKV